MADLYPFHAVCLQLVYQVITRRADGLNQHRRHSICYELRNRHLLFQQVFYNYPVELLLATKPTNDFQQALNGNASYTIIHA